jgi:predicted permease
MLQDLRYAFRALLRKPLATAVAAITLGLGIGGATAVFGVVEAVLLRPLPFAEPDRLVRIWELTRGGDRFSFSAPNYLDLRDQARTLAQITAYAEVGATAVLADGAEPQRIGAVPVSASLPGVLGVSPQIGQMFTADDDRPGGAARRIVLSDGLWRRRFGGDPGILGRSLMLDGNAYVVTGVMPPRFDFPGGADAWVPLAADRASDRGDKSLAVIGRLAPGTTLAQARGELRDIARRTADAYPEFNAGWSAEAIPFSEWIVAPRFRDAVWVLAGAAAVLLLLACANVANLLVAGAAARRAEMQVRAALGAGRERLIRQLLTEAGLLAALGTVAGILFGSWFVAAIHALGVDRLPRVDELQMNERVLVFTCLVGAASCLLFGLAPALHAARVDLRSGMDEGIRYSPGSRRLRNAIVVVEVALALLLLVSAGLLANSFIRLVSVDTGFAAENAIAIPIDLPSTRYPEGRAASFYTNLLDRVRALPGVTAAGATSTNPFRQFGFSNSVTPEDRAAEAPPSGLVQAGWRSVTPGFFEAMRIPVLSGRTFTDADREGAERVAIVSVSLARRLWPGTDAVGKRIYWGDVTGQTRTIVGVTGDIRDVQLEAEPTPMLFVPHAQVDLPSMTLILRTPGSAALVAPGVRDVLRQMDGSLPAPPIHDIAASRSASVAGPRFNLSLLATFAGIALVLAVTGVYAMLAFTVSERRREIAVRLALGADGPRIARLVLRDGLTLAITGIAAGIVAALAVTRVLSSVLYGITATDPATFAAAAAGLLAVAALACYLPARHASRLDPVAILRR